MCQAGCDATYTYDDDLSDSTYHYVLNTLDEYKPYTPVQQEGTYDNHKGIHEYCAEAITVRQIVQYKWEYNRAIQLANSLWLVILAICIPILKWMLKVMYP